MHLLRTLPRLGAVALAAAVLLPASLHAQETVGISPLIIEKVLSPGTVYKDVIRVSNTGKTAVRMKDSVADFYYNERGLMQFVEETEKPLSTASLKAWLDIEGEELTLEPGDTKQLAVTITVPENAEPGGHYGVLFMQTIAAGDQIVNVEGRVGTLVLVEIPGEVKKTAELGAVAVGLPKMIDNIQGFETKTFFENAPIHFAFTMKNTGNVHFTPDGTIEVKNLFGRTVGRMSAQPDERAARYRSFPGVQRQFVREWSDPGFLVGRYTAVFDVRDGNGKSLGAKEIAFTVFPWKFLFTMLLMTLIGVSLIVTLVKRYNHWLIEKARRHR